MPQGLPALALMLVLLPGFVCAGIVQMLCTRPKQTELEKVIESLTFSFVVYVIFSLTTSTELPLSWTTQVADGATRYSVVVQRWRLGLLMSYAVLLGFAWGWVINHDALLAWMRRLKFTQRTSRSSVWNDIFHTLGGTVQIGLADGRMIRGWLRCYSDEADDSTLFLESASWIGEGFLEYPVNGPGILVTKQSEIQYVMFLDEAIADSLPASGVGGPDKPSD